MQLQFGLSQKCRERWILLTPNFTPSLCTDRCVEAPEGVCARRVTLLCTGRCGATRFAPLVPPLEPFHPKLFEPFHFDNVGVLAPSAFLDLAVDCPQLCNSSRYSLLMINYP
jgi:hypothetical protein